MKKKKHSLAGNLVNALQIPGDLAYQDPIVTITGAREVFVENYKCIMEYEADHLMIQLRKSCIRIEGTHLQITYYTKEEMKITGCIRNIVYCL
ncbi:MAG: YabP/YqfC family sporulation protein [Lachnospiraceae bacterium]